MVAIGDEPSYPLYRVAVWVTGADIGSVDPVLTFVCRPHNPTGALVDIPDARPLVVDEAYFEYAGETAVPLLDEGVIVVRSSRRHSASRRRASATRSPISTPRAS